MWGLSPSPDMRRNPRAPLPPPDFSGGLRGVSLTREFDTPQAIPLDQALYKTFGVVTSEGRRGLLYFHELSPEGWARIRNRIYR